MINKFIFTISLSIFLILETVLSNIGFDVLIVEIFIIWFFFINKEYLKKFKRHTPERILFNYYTIVSIVFLLLKSYFVLTTYSFTFLLVLIFIMYILSEYCEEKLNIMFLGMLILLFISIYIVQIFTPYLEIENYFIALNFKTLTYITMNVALDVLIFLMFNKVYKNRLLIDEEN